jgi:hypothetical protein
VTREKEGRKQAAQPLTDNEDDAAGHDITGGGETRTSLEVGTARLAMESARGSPTGARKKTLGLRV